MTWLRLGKGPKGGLDRATQKFDTVSAQLKEIQKLCAELTLADAALQPKAEPCPGR